MNITDLVSPESTTNGDNREFGGNDSPTDGDGNFLGALPSQANVSVRVANGNESLEAGALSGAGLLLDGLHLHDLILHLWEEEVHHLVLLDWQGEEVHLLN